MENLTLSLDTFLREHAYELRENEVLDYEPLLEAIGEKRIVLIGEASHGTHEFYRERAMLTQHLIEEHGFNAVAIEGDFPDALRVHRYVTGVSFDGDAAEALGGFKRFPTWMWRNSDVLDFVGWLRNFNDRLGKDERRVGFYGLDLYSLHSSMEEVLSYLLKVDPEAAERARNRYSCFDHFGNDSQRYGYAANLGISKSCKNEVINQLLEMNARHHEDVTEDSELFYAIQNARLVKNAEHYYRMMFRSDVSSWNLRDQHMMETLTALDHHLSEGAAQSKIIVWEHNSHVGDARATEMGRRGELNLGQLTREHFGEDVYSIGFTTYDGTVTAASDWGGVCERKVVRPALNASIESLLHDVGLSRFMLLLTRDPQLASALADPLLERAIGVIYRPETERQSHYFNTKLSEQFDAVIHIDSTRAVEPLERSTEWFTGEVLETYPSGV